MELVNKNTSLYVQRCCGKKCLKLWCVLSAVQCVTLYILTFYMFNKRVHLFVKRILMLSKCTVQQSKIIYYCWKPVSAFVCGVEDGIYPLLQSSSVGAGSNKANGGSNGQPQAGGGANSVGSARQQQQQQQQSQQSQQQPQQGSKPVECNLCHRTFKNIPALNGHMRLHGGYFKKVRTRCNISVS